MPRHVKTSSGICGQRRPRSDCASAQSDQGLQCPLKESLDTREWMNGEQRPMWLRMRRMIWICAYCAFSKLRFHFAWPNKKKNDSILLPSYVSEGSSQVSVFPVNTPATGTFKSCNCVLIWKAYWFFLYKYLFSVKRYIRCMMPKWRHYFWRNNYQHSRRFVRSYKG